jgi:hypothetical protein
VPEMHRALNCALVAALSGRHRRISREDPSPADSSLRASGLARPRASP